MLFGTSPSFKKCNITLIYLISRYAALTNTTSTVLFSAHYDSRGSFGQTRAPGADDDGSGTIALLSIARTILRKGVKFHSNVELVAFAGEEQGLLGSKAYARKFSNKLFHVYIFTKCSRRTSGSEC